MKLKLAKSGFGMFLFLFLVLCFYSCTTNKKMLALPENFMDTLKYEKEIHLKNVRQLTFGGDNAEAYWSFDDKKIVFQATNKRWGVECDQIYYFDLEKTAKDGKKSLPIKYKMTTKSSAAAGTFG